VSTEATASVSTHILDTSVGRPAEGVAVSLSARGDSGGAAGQWQALGGSRTDRDGRCEDLPALPPGTDRVRLDFETEAYFATDDQDTEKQAEVRQEAPALRDSGAFFPEVAITFNVTPGEHYHVPLQLNPFGYCVYRGS